MKKLLLCGSLLFAGAAFSQVLFEDFEGATPALPTGWTSSAATAGGEFYTGDAGDANAAAYWPVIGGTTFAMANDDVCNCDMTNAILTTPSMDLSGVSGAVLIYDFVDDMSYGPSLPHDVELSTDGGASWTNVYSHNTDNQGNLSWATNTVSLGAEADGASDVQVRWIYNDNGTWATGLAIDNVVVKEPAQNDAELTGITIDRYVLANSNTTLTAEVTNVGANAITMLEIDWNDGTNHAESVSVNIAPGASASVAHPTIVNYAAAVEKNISVTINTVNGAVDGDPSNNSGSALHNTLSQQTSKAVVIEEGTGTWCGWCPRGAVAMDYMIETCPTNFIGVAVHNGNPMTVQEYDGNMNLPGYPSANVDRAILGASVSQGLFEQYYNERVALGVPANVSVTASGSGANVTIDASASFYTPVASANFRLAVVITEDGVTGTGSGYNQANYYSGGGQGNMGGYESLPDPVPAADMVYDHVGRALLGGFNGQPGSVPGSITDGQVASYSFNYSVPSSSDRDNMHAVVMLINSTTGEIVNASQISIAEEASVLDLNTVDFNVYPNPASDAVNVSFEAIGETSVSIMDLQGRILATQFASSANGTQVITFATEGFAKGTYVVSVKANGLTSNTNVVIK